MEWTTESPTERGFYWAFDCNTQHVNLEMVQVDEATYGDVTKLAALAFGSDTWRDLSEYTHWCGPIDKPHIAWKDSNGVIHDSRLELLPNDAENN